MIPTQIKGLNKETCRRAAAPMLAIVKRFFEDPKNRADFEEWLAKKQNEGVVHNAGQDT